MCYSEAVFVAIKLSQLQTDKCMLKTKFNIFSC